MGVPYYDYSIIYPKPYSNKAPIVGLTRLDVDSLLDGSGHLCSSILEWPPLRRGTSSEREGERETDTAVQARQKNAGCYGVMLPYCAGVFRVL